MIERSASPTTSCWSPTSSGSRARAASRPSGRGSGAGSIVAYVLGITNVDPLRYGLTFERFLHPTRRDCPDLDIDLCWQRRDEVIAHVYDTYGAEPRGDDLDARDARRALRVPRDGEGARRAERARERLARLVPHELEPPYRDAAARAARGARDVDWREPPLAEALRAGRARSTARRATSRSTAAAS